MACRPLIRISVALLYLTYHWSMTRAIGLKKQHNIVWSFTVCVFSLTGYFDCYERRKSHICVTQCLGRDRTAALMWTFVVRCRRGFVRRNVRAARQMKEKANSCELYRTSSNGYIEAQDMTMLVCLCILHALSLHMPVCKETRHVC